MAKGFEVPRDNDDVAKLEITGGSTYSIATKLQKAFQEAGFSNHYDFAERDFDTQIIVFDDADMTPTLEVVKSIVQTLPEEQQKKVKAFGYTELDL